MRRTCRKRGREEARAVRWSESTTNEKKYEPRRNLHNLRHPARVHSALLNQGPVETKILIPLDRFRSAGVEMAHDVVIGKGGLEDARNVGGVCGVDAVEGECH